MQHNEHKRSRGGLHPRRVPADLRGRAVDPMRRRIVGAALCTPWLSAAAEPVQRAIPVPVLVYHRFAQEVFDSMALRVSTFDAHCS
jgi:hypothetical protein